jgi:putative lipase involved disintegration of autophagic bodies
MYAGLNMKTCLLIILYYMQNHKIATTDHLKQKFKVDKNFIKRVLKRILPFIEFFNNKYLVIPDAEDLLRISREYNIDEMFNECGYILDGTDIRVFSIEDKMSSLFLESFGSYKMKYKKAIRIELLTNMKPKCEGLWSDYGNGKFKL